MFDFSFFRRFTGSNTWQFECLVNDGGLMLTIMKFLVISGNAFLHGSNCMYFNVSFCGWI